jgi:hypothetical protein
LSETQWRNSLSGRDQRHYANEETDGYSCTMKRVKTNILSAGMAMAWRQYLPPDPIQVLMMPQSNNEAIKAAVAIDFSSELMNVVK